MAKTSKRKRRSTKSGKTAARQKVTSISRISAAIPDSPGNQFLSFTIPPKGSRPRNPNPIPTGGRLFPDGTSLELTRGAELGEERLLRWSDGESSTARSFEISNSRYVPSKGAGLIPYLPDRPLPYESTATLFKAVAEFIAKHSGLGKENVDLLSFVAFSSFFFDATGLSPCVLLLGPPIPAISLLRVMQCISRHGILSAASSVRGLPPELRPTRLICQADANIDKELAALQFRGVQSLSGTPREISAATFIYTGETEFKTPFADVCLALPVGIDTPSFSIQDEQLELPTITRIQNQLLLYRLQNHSRVKSSRFDAPEFAGFSREFARTLGASIVDSPDLQSRLVELLRPQDKADRTQNSATLEAFVLEALVVACHEKKPSIHAGEVAQLANNILKERGEVVKISPKRAGGRLRKLGFRTGKLDSGGIGIYLLGQQCARIHELGRAFGVATLREGLPGCPHCQK